MFRWIDKYYGSDEGGHNKRYWGCWVARGGSNLGCFVSLQTRHLQKMLGFEFAAKYSTTLTNPVAPTAFIRSNQTTENIQHALIFGIDGLF